MNHLIDGCLIAIENGPYIASNDSKGLVAKGLMQEWTNHMHKVLAHYENGGTIQNRP